MGDINQTVVFFVVPLALSVLLARSHVFAIIVCVLMQVFYFWKKTTVVDDLSSMLLFVVIVVLGVTRIVEQRWPGGRRRPLEKNLLWAMAALRAGLNFVYLQEILSLSRTLVLPNFGGKVTSVAIGMVEYLNMGLMGVAGLGVVLIVLYLAKPEV